MEARAVRRAAVEAVQRLLARTIANDDATLTPTESTFVSSLGVPATAAEGGGSELKR